MPTPAATIKVDRRPSEIFIVTDWLTKEVSADKRLINSPVLFLSKNAISCLTMALKTDVLILLVIRRPKISSPKYNLNQDIKITPNYYCIAVLKYLKSALDKLFQSCTILQQEIYLIVRDILYPSSA